MAVLRGRAGRLLGSVMGGLSRSRKSLVWQACRGDEIAWEWEASIWK